MNAYSVIPAKRGKAGWRRQSVRAPMQAQFPKALYSHRALVECVFSAVKRKLSSRGPGRSLATLRLQAFLLGLAYNIYRLKPCRKYQPFAFAQSGGYRPPKHFNKADKAPTYQDRIRGFAQRLSRGLDRMGFTQRRELLWLLVDEVVYDDHQVTIKTIIPLGSTGSADEVQLYPVPQGGQGDGRRSFSAACET